MFNNYIKEQIDSISDERKKEIESMIDKYLLKEEESKKETILPLIKEKDGKFELPYLNL